MKYLLIILNIFVVIIFVQFIEPAILKPNEKSLIIEFKIRHQIFPYLISDSIMSFDDYDYYLLDKKYDLPKIFDFIKERKESRFYFLTRYLYLNSDEYLNLSDDKIIDSLRFLVTQKQYILELKQNQEKYFKLKDRVRQINEYNEYFKIYKAYILEKL